ncbi:Farnesoate epoxidase [Orchesella cincta]|uniref:Farnesoate epoxidase n=1 Tax=Orchesella cincta TaxID=48709 RepID=A0A1D2M7M8_ORCCI|nr:Farnesoate epoxidase [Orchesella cincta]
MILVVNILILVIFLLVWWFVQDKRSYKNYPPGPPRMPILGNILQIASQSSFPSVAFLNLSKKYGDVMFLKMGMVEAVTFNSPDSVHEILHHEKAIDRTRTMLPLIQARMYGKNLGLIFSSGESWQKLRHFTIRTLKDFGFGKAASMDVVVLEEMDKFVGYLETKMQRDGVVEVDGLFNLTLVNMLWRLVTGINYSMNDKKIQKLLKLSNDMIKNTKFSFDASATFPFLWHLFPSWSGKNLQMMNITALQEYCRETLEYHRRNCDYKNHPESYVDVFLQKIDETRKNPESEFTDDQLVLCLLDLFQAGAETSSQTLSFSMLYMLIHQDIQGKVQKEIDEVVGKGEVITLDMKSRLPYTQAAVLECLRKSMVAPFPAARQATDDFYFRDYFIKKGTIIMPNLECVHLDRGIWGDPHNFRPERFLNKDMSIDTKLAGKMLLFGGGKRVCLAQSLAETTIFLVLQIS